MKVGSRMFRLTVCAGSFLYLFYVLCNFMYFLSNQCGNQNAMKRVSLEQNFFPSMLWILIINTCLISTFLLQHSLMATDSVKRFYTFLNIDDLERCIYNACSAAVIHFMIKMWIPATFVVLWDIDTDLNPKIWFIIVTCHILGWFIIYSGCLMMDISELVGIKQVWYKISGRPCPLGMKSRELRRYFAHMRHPSFTGFLMILWVHPFMSIDRALLALIFTVYMILMWKIDEEDYRYHSLVIQRKKRKFC